MTMKMNSEERIEMCDVNRTRMGKWTPGTPYTHCLGRDERTSREISYSEQKGRWAMDNAQRWAMGSLLQGLGEITQILVTRVPRSVWDHAL